MFFPGAITRFDICTLLPAANLFSFMATAVRLKESVFMFLTRWEREKEEPAGKPVHLAPPVFPAHDKRFIDN
jgi:hypothetical protein